VCVVPKVFRTRFSPEPVTRVMKLNKRKIHWIIRQKQKGVPTKQIALDMKISRRRVQQLWKGYVDTGREPATCENMGQPKKLFDKREAHILRIRIKRIGTNGFDTNGSTMIMISSCTLNGVVLNQSRQVRNTFGTTQGRFQRISLPAPSDPARRPGMCIEAYRIPICPAKGNAP